MNVFLLSPEKRLKEWRNFRKELLDLSYYDQLQNTIEWWSHCPLANRSIDPFTPDHWPTSWELMYKGDFCKFSIVHYFNLHIII